MSNIVDFKLETTEEGKVKIKYTANGLSHDTEGDLNIQTLQSLSYLLQKFADSFKQKNNPYF